MHDILAVNLSKVMLLITLSKVGCMPQVKFTMHSMSLTAAIVLAQYTANKTYSSVLVVTSKASTHSLIKQQDLMSGISHSMSIYTSSTVLS